VLCGILTTLESRLGLLHPETLTSQLWCFTVDVLLQDDGSNIEDKTVDDFIENLSDPKVVKERLVESLIMKRQLAGLLSGTSKSEAAKRLVDGAILELDEIKVVNENDGLEEIGDYLRKTLSDLRETLPDLKKTFVA
jgi:hypothetical protein